MTDPKLICKYLKVNLVEAPGTVNYKFILKFGGFSAPRNKL